jgi:hypothetical protein
MTKKYSSTPPPTPKAILNTPYRQEARWAPEPVWLLLKKEKVCALARNVTTFPDIQSVV